METTSKIFEGTITYNQNEVEQILADDSKLISEIDQMRLVSYATRYMWAVRLAEQVRKQTEKMQAELGRELTKNEAMQAQLEGLSNTLASYPIFNKH